MQGARFLVWVHLTQQQVQALRSEPKQAGALTPWQLLADIVAPPAASTSNGSTSETSAQPGDFVTDGIDAASTSSSGCNPVGSGCLEVQRQILVDLFSHVLQQGQAWGFTDEKLSCLFSIVKELHDASVWQRLTIERSFSFFKETMLNHSIQRPPFSIGVFTQQEMHAILQWALHSYYRHYKLYQYAFTSRVTMHVASAHPADAVEVPPATGVPPLQGAATEEQHQQQLDVGERQRAAEAANAEAAAAEAAEEARKRAIEEEFVASVPEDLKERVTLMLEKEMAGLKKAMERRFQEQQQELLSKLSVLEARQALSVSSK